MFMMHTYIVHITIQKICLHDSPEFEPKTLLKACLCLCYQPTQLFVNKKWAIFLIIFLSIKP
jgi:elongation factor P--beta-lysine ligase